MKEKNVSVFFADDAKKAYKMTQETHSALLEVYKNAECIDNVYSWIQEQITSKEIIELV